jgi:hypothetical protein
MDRLGNAAEFGPNLLAPVGQAGKKFRRIIMPAIEVGLQVVE